MPVISINNVGKFGVVKDLPAHKLPPEAWTDIKNFHMLEGGAKKAAGHEEVYDPPSVSPYGLMFVPEPSNLYWLYMGLAKVYGVDAIAGTHYDLTRATGGDYNADQDIGWNGAVLGNIPVINNGVDDPQMWNPVSTGQKLQALSNWPANTKARVIRGFKQFLIALDVTEGATRYPYIMRVSDVADPGAVPGSWDYSDPANLSIRRALQEGEDFLIDCVPLGDTNIIYKEHSVWGMQFIGGQSVWRTFKLPLNFGIMNRNCAVPIPKGRQLVVTDNYDLVVHNGQTDDSVMSARTRRWLEGQLDPTYYQRSFLAVNPLDNEVFFCFCTVGNSVPTRAIVWNWDTNSIGTQELENFSFGAYGFATTGGAATIDELIMNIDEMDWPIDSGLESRFTRHLLWAKPDATSPKLFKGHSTAQFNGVNIEAYVERTGLALIGRDRQGNPIVDLERMKFLRRVIPRIEAASGTQVQVYVGSQETIEGAITWQGPYTFTVGIDLWVDTMISSKLLAVRFRTTGNVQWTLHGYDLDIELDGEY